MAINLDKMRSKLDHAEGKGKRASSVFWKPQDGEQTIRVLPMSDGDPFHEMWFHYNLGQNRGFLSPKKNFGEDDPLDSFVRKLFNDGTDDSVKMAKNLMARQRFFSPVIVRGEEEKGVRLWGYGKMAYKDLLSLVLNPDYGDITDPEVGTDLVLQYGKPAGASYPQTNITPRRRSSALCDESLGGSKMSAEWLGSIPEFDEVFAESRKTPAEVGQMLDEWLSGESIEKEDVEKYGSESGSVVDQKLNQLLDTKIPF
jgi:hypothetical protein